MSEMRGRGVVGLGGCDGGGCIGRFVAVEESRGS